MTWAELEPIALDWAEVFFGIIPQDQLHAAYLAAKQSTDRKPEDKKFPLKDTEILDAFYRQRAAGSGKPTHCNFCSLYAYDSTEYPPCPFHQRDLLTAAPAAKGLQL